jgi:hypothetical protein
MIKNNAQESSRNLRNLQECTPIYLASRIRDNEEGVKHREKKKQHLV